MNLRMVPIVSYTLNTDPYDLAIAIIYFRIYGTGILQPVARTFDMKISKLKLLYVVCAYISH